MKNVFAGLALTAVLAAGMILAQGPGTGGAVFDTSPTFNGSIKMKGAQTDQYTTTFSAASATADRTYPMGEIQATHHVGAAALLIDQSFFVATRAYEVQTCSFTHATAETTAANLRVQVVKDTGTDAPGAGTDLLTNNSNAGFNVKGTINTTVVGTFTATTATLRLAAGDRLSVDYEAAATEGAQVTITCTLRPI